MNPETFQLLRLLARTSRARRDACASLYPPDYIAAMRHLRIRGILPLVHRLQWHERPNQ